MGGGGTGIIYLIQQVLASQKEQCRILFFQMPVIIRIYFNSPKLFWGQKVKY